MIRFHVMDLYDSIKIDGPLKKKIVCIEEMSELTKEITKDLREMPIRENIIEEMSDVYICLQMLRLMYKVTDKEIQDVVDYKVERQKLRDMEKIRQRKNESQEKKI